MLHKNNFQLIVLTLVVIILLPGCATILKGTSERVSVTSDPSGANVLINGIPRGNTPMVLKLESKNIYVVEIRKENYLPYTYTLTNSVGAGWIIIDVICGLVPVIIDAATGSWYMLDANHVHGLLQK